MRQFNILLVEDDQIDALNVKRAFAHLHIVNPVHHVLDGQYAIDWLLENPADDIKPLLILLDINMPRVNGFEFLDHLRTLHSHEHTPVVVLTTSCEEGDKIKAYSRHISGYVVKPIDHKQFVEAMAIIGNYWALCEIV